jgi:hypothetical protein
MTNDKPHFDHVVAMPKCPICGARAEYNNEGFCYCTECTWTDEFDPPWQDWATRGD